MLHKEFTWQTSDHIQLYGQCWEPDSEPLAVVCLVHGLGEHSDRYQHVARRLIEAKLAVIAFDLRGHGKSGGQRGHTPSFEAFMTDIDLLMQDASQRYPGKPLIIYGHSLGGLLVLNYVERRKPAIAATVATSSGLLTALQEQKINIFLAKILGSIAPTGSMASGLDADGLCHDKMVIEEYVQDPLVHNKASFGMGKELIGSIDYVFAHASEFPTPLLLMHGEKDPIAYPAGSEKFAALVGSLATLKIWPGMYHELHNEVCKEEVLDYMVQWMLSKLPPDPSRQS